MMKSLEDVNVEGTSYYIQTGADGINRQVPNSYSFKLKVKTVDAGLRFVHMIVDYFVLVTLTYTFSAIPGVSNMVLALLNLAVFVTYPLYYAFMEFYFQQTVGKMLTGSVVIDKYANKPDLKTCLLRTIIRIVPFEPFSCLGNSGRAWHDKWADTYVVKKEEVEKLKLLLDKENSTSDLIL